MRRARRRLGPSGRKLFDLEMSRIICMRNIRISYELNHEWEQLNREIWVCAAQIVFYRVFAAPYFFALATRSVTFARKWTLCELYIKYRIAYDRYVKLWRAIARSEKALMIDLVPIFWSIDAYFSYKLFISNEVRKFYEF